MKATPQEAEKAWANACHKAPSPGSYLWGISDFKAAYRKALEEEIGNIKNKLELATDSYTRNKYAFQGSGLKRAIELLETVKPPES